MTIGIVAATANASRASFEERQTQTHERVKPRGTRALARVACVTRHGARAPLRITTTTDDGESTRWRALMLDVEHRRKLRTSARVRDEDEASASEAEDGEPRDASGELTIRGAREMMDLGQRVIRKWLIDEEKFLSSEFANAVRLGEVKVRSTAARRCVMSAQSVIYGGWGDVSSRVLEIEVRSKEQESMFPKPGKACERLNDFFKSEVEVAERESRASLGKHPALARIRDELEAQSGGAATEVTVWDKLQCMLNHDMELPEGVTAEDVGALLTSMERRYFTLFSRPEIAALVGGRLLRELCDEMASPEPFKLSIFSGHDSSLIALFAALGVLDVGVRAWPATASALIFETWHMLDGTRGVRAVYNGKPLMLTPKSRASDGMTSYDDFKAFVDARVPSDFEAACRVSKL